MNLINATETMLRTDVPFKERDNRLNYYYSQFLLGIMYEDIKSSLKGSTSTEFFSCLNVKIPKIVASDTKIFKITDNNTLYTNLPGIIEKREVQSALIIKLYCKDKSIINNISIESQLKIKQAADKLECKTFIPATLTEKILLELAAFNSKINAKNVVSSIIGEEFDYITNDKRYAVYKNKIDLLVENKNTIISISHEDFRTLKKAKLNTIEYNDILGYLQYEGKKFNLDILNSNIWR